MTSSSFSSSSSSLSSIPLRLFICISSAFFLSASTLFFLEINFFLISINFFNLIFNFFKSSSRISVNLHSLSIPLPQGAISLLLLFSFSNFNNSLTLISPCLKISRLLKDFCSPMPCFFKKFPLLS